MRQINTIRSRFVHALRGHYTPTGDQPSPSRLMDTELCLYLLETVADDQAASGVPALLDGYRALWGAVPHPPDDAAVRLANARSLLWRSQRPYGWDELLRAYLSAPEAVRGYHLDPLGRPVRRQCSVAANRWDWYEQLLTKPLPFATTGVRFAEPGRYRMSSTARGHGVTIPDNLPPAPAPNLHDLAVRTRTPIEVTWQELVATARGMDAADLEAGRSSHRWEERLLDVTLQVRLADDTFGDATALRIDRMLHMVGMVSVGKSTLVTILATWAAAAWPPGDDRGRRQLGGTTHGARAVLVRRRGGGAGHGTEPHPARGATAPAPAACAWPASTLRAVRIRLGQHGLPARCRSERPHPPRGTRGSLPAPDRNRSGRPGGWLAGRR